METLKLIIIGFGDRSVGIPDAQMVLDTGYPEFVYNMSREKFAEDFFNMSREKFAEDFFKFLVERDMLPSNRGDMWYSDECPECRTRLKVKGSVIDRKCPNKNCWGNPPEGE